MKTRQVALLLAVFSLLLGCDAKAFYNSSVGCWPNRDPFDESGFTLLTSGKLRPLLSSDAYKELSDQFISNLDEHHLLNSRNISRGVVRLIGDINLYGFIGNDPFGWIDTWGLGTWKLTLNPGGDSWFSPGVVITAEYTTKSCCNGYRMDRYAKFLRWVYDGNSGMSDKKHWGLDGNNNHPAQMVDQPGYNSLIAYIKSIDIDFRWEIHCLNKDGTENPHVISTISEGVLILGNNGRWDGYLPGEYTITMSDSND